MNRVHKLETMNCKTQICCQCWVMHKLHSWLWLMPGGDGGDGCGGGGGQRGAEVPNRMFIRLRCSIKICTNRPTHTCTSDKKILLNFSDSFLYSSLQPAELRKNGASS